MLCFEAMAQALGGKVAGGIARKAERFGDRGAEEGIAKGIEHQGQGAFGDMMCVMTDCELRNETANRIEDRVQRVAVAGDDHPGGEGAGALPAEGVKALIDDDPCIGFAGAGELDGFGDAAVDRVRDRLGEFTLKSCRRAEVVKQIGVGAPDFPCDGLERDRLRPLFDQEFARCGERGGAALCRGQAGTSY